MNIFGIDEAGRGAFAGPLSVAGIYISKHYQSLLQSSGLCIRDSKTLSEKQRESVYQWLCDHNIPFFSELISTEEINSKGIGWANTEGIKRIIHQHILCARPGLAQAKVVVDGRFPLHQIGVSGVDVSCCIDADATIFPVIVAGIIAKVTRDRVMKTIHEEYPVYLWKKNKGYGTEYHIDMLKQFGLSTYHRIQFVHTALSK